MIRRHGFAFYHLFTNTMHQTNAYQQYIVIIEIRFFLDLGPVENYNLARVTNLRPLSSEVTLGLSLKSF